MGELLDRGFQRQILIALQSAYPRSVKPTEMFGEQADNRLLVNLAYLDEHDLIDLTLSTFMDGEITLDAAKITAAGMDFIADDGGLSAILGVVTVKLHEDTIRQLVIDKIQKADGDQSVKSALIDKVKSLPAEALGKLAVDGLGTAISKAPDALNFLTDMLG
ncbi:hypothetical protein [Pseudochrobactrum asaccharolyticum]|uniref:Uncharacterized protein n=1 Tax=Pseudochrobactrum asaccharolyticum TaxID=354351 RepID=A0A366DIA3_9HYPH|nr:hypothetical protein [Pseudochrobactrum asaccharolyticum]RBO89675.1 hypothetical protein DFR47_11542 [Pseudochrobactrum asaccharolyticum]